MGATPSPATALTPLPSSPFAKGEEGCWRCWHRSARVAGSPEAKDLRPPNESTLKGAETGVSEGGQPRSRGFRQCSLRSLASGGAGAATLSAPRARRSRRIAAGFLLTVLLAGCASSPEAARVRGEPGADPGNHGNPVVLVEPPSQVERIYYEIPYDGPAVASEDTSQS